MVGVYKIINTETQDFYIGSSTDCRRRKTHHFSKLRNNKHKNQYLQRAFNKYGEDSFVFEVIEECTKNSLLEVEQKYLDNEKPPYNLVYVAGGMFMVGYKMTKRQRKVLSDLKTGLKHSEKTKQKLREYNLGNKHSKKTKKKLSEISKKNWESIEYRNKVLSRCKSVSFIDQDTGQRVVCSDIFEAERKTPYTFRTIRFKINGYTNNEKYKFRYE